MYILGVSCVIVFVCVGVCVCVCVRSRASVLCTLYFVAVYQHTSLEEVGHLNTKLLSKFSYIYTT